MKIILAITTAFLFIATSPAHSEVIYDSFGPGDTFNTSSSFHVGGGVPSGVYPDMTFTDEDQASPFIISQQNSYRLDSIELAISHQNGPTNILDLSIVENDPTFGQYGKPDESKVVEQFRLVNQVVRDFPGPQGTESILTVDSVIHPILESGKTYWLVASLDLSTPEDKSFMGWWGSIVENLNPPHGQRNTGKEWRIVVSTGHGPAYRITGTPALVPVVIDIMPDSDTNSINFSSAGVIPVAILGAVDFDVADVDPASVSLAGASVKLVGKSEKYLCHQEDVNLDGFIDLICQIYTVQFFVEEGEATAILEAETIDGTKLRGEDFIRIVPDN